MPLHAAGSLFDAVAFEMEGVVATLSAYALVHTLRDVHDWLAARETGRRPRQRPDFTRRHLDRIPELQPTLATLHQLAHAPDRGEDVAPGVARACAQVSAWAEQRGARHTALAFAQTAADAQPGDGWTSYRVARLARLYGRPQDALRWWRWSAGQARGGADAELYALSLSARGSTCAEEGDTARALILLRGACRAAASAGLRAVAGAARHELAMVYFALGLEARAHAEVLRAVEGYGPGHGQLPELARDVAFMWLEHHEHARAAELCAVVLETVGEPARRVLLLAYQARAAAALGWGRPFESAWNNLWGTLGTLLPGGDEAFALVQLALAAATAGSWLRASVAAEVALEAARRGGDAAVAATAEQIIEAAHTGVVPADLELRIAAPGAHPVPRRDTGADAVLTGFVAALRGRHEPAPPSLHHPAAYSPEGDSARSDQRAGTPRADRTSGSGSGDAPC